MKAFNSSCSPIYYLCGGLSLAAAIIWLTVCVSRASQQPITKEEQDFELNSADPSESQQFSDSEPNKPMNSC